MNIENITSKGISLNINGQSMQREIYEREIVKLQSNWNSLREWLEKQISNDLDGIFSYSGRQCKETLDKMNELESGGKD